METMRSPSTTTSPGRGSAPVPSNTAPPAKRVRAIPRPYVVPGDARMRHVAGGRSPLAVVVSGIPASGKTTLARQLALALELPLVSKDVIKEALFDALGTG